MNRRARGFVECACLAFDGKDDHRKVRKATHILEQMPGLASHSIYTAAADVAHVRRLLQERPGRAVEPGGPRDWVPLLDVGADPDGADILAKNTPGYTPLGCAPNQGEGIREFLIERGVDGGERPEGD